MRFILEHPWLAFISVSAVALIFIRTGLRDGKLVRIKIGAVVFFIAMCTCALGLIIDTPTEHAKRVVKTFVQAVENRDETLARNMVKSNVVMVDQWKGVDESGEEGVVAAMNTLHSKHTIRFNTILRIRFFERAEDVLVELALLSRISGIGTVPSTWKIIIQPDEKGKWEISSIDAIEIMGRVYR